jgi:hypothetical protein
MAKTESVTHRSVGPRAVAPFVFAADAAERAAEVMALVPNLERLGISGLTPNMTARMMHQMGVSGFAMDAALQPTLTTASVTTPIQFLQKWLPGFVGIITAARKIDEILGMATAGDWDDEEVVQGTLEGTAGGALYGDYTNVPLSSWNVTFEARTIVRWEQGMRAGVLEEGRAGKVAINSAETKRNASPPSSLKFSATTWPSAASTAATTHLRLLERPRPAFGRAVPWHRHGQATAWADKNFAQIQADIRLMVSTLRSQSQDTIDPETTPLTLVLPTNVVDYLTTTTDQGVSVRAWMTEAYPKIRVVSAPQMELAIAGDNGAYLQAETVNDGIHRRQARVDSRCSHEVQVDRRQPANQGLRRRLLKRHRWRLPEARLRDGAVLRLLIGLRVPSDGL